MYAANSDKIEIVVFGAALSFGMRDDIVEGSRGELILSAHQVADLFQ